ncbi:MAG: hypothetical protein AB1806_12765 [Acidobacteriota bacterium]
MRITEPMTLVTDYVMGTLAALWAVKLLRASAATGSLPTRLWGLAFVATAVASFAGGSWHGFIQMMSPGEARALWKMTLIATGIGSAALLASVAMAATTGTLQRVLLVAAAVKLIVYAWWMSSHDDFIFVIYDYGSALLAVVLLAWWSSSPGVAPAAGWIFAGVGVAVVAALIQALGLAPHKHFNHNDLFHVVQMVALYLLYRAGLLLRAA